MPARKYTAEDVTRANRVSVVPPKFGPEQPSAIDEVLASLQQYNPNAQPGDPDFDWDRYGEWKARQRDPVADARPLVDQFNEEDRVARDLAAAGEQERLQDIASHPVREMGREVGQSVISGRLPLEIGATLLTGGTAGPAASGIGRVGRAIASAPATVALEAASYLPGWPGRIANAVRTVQSLLGGRKGRGVTTAAGDAVKQAPMPKDVVTGSEMFTDVAKRRGRGVEVPFKAPTSARVPYRTQTEKLSKGLPEIESIEALAADVPGQSIGSIAKGRPVPPNKQVTTVDLNELVNSLKQSQAPVPMKAARSASSTNLYGPGSLTETGVSGYRPRPNPRPVPQEDVTVPDMGTVEPEMGMSTYPPRPGDPGFGRQRVREDVKFMSQEPLTTLIESLRAESDLPAARITRVKKTPKPSGTSPTARAIRQRGHAFGEY